MIQHEPTCTPNYPEKNPREKPQHIEVIPGGTNGTEIHQCTDCGAFEEVKTENKRKERPSNETA